LNLPQVRKVFFSLAMLSTWMHKKRRQHKHRIILDSEGCQMVCFQTKNPNFGKFWRVWLCKILGIFYDHLVYFMAIWNILWPFGIFCGNLVYWSPFWYFGPRKIWQPFYLVLVHEWAKIAFIARVARFSLVQYTKIWRMNQMTTKCTKWPYHLPNNYKM
jgi:hypothetical protein